MPNSGAKRLKTGKYGRVRKGQTKKKRKGGW
jgi:hypothetical protein